VQQHENLQLIIASQVDQLTPILALFARISKPLCLNVRSTGAEGAGGQKTFFYGQGKQRGSGKSQGILKYCSLDQLFMHYFHNYCWLLGALPPDPHL